MHFSHKRPYFVNKYNLERDWSRQKWKETVTFLSKLRTQELNVKCKHRNVTFTEKLADSGMRQIVKV